MFPSSSRASPAMSFPGVLSVAILKKEGKFSSFRMSKLCLLPAVPYAHIPGFRFLPTRINTRMKEIDIEVKRILLSIIKKREESMKLGAAKNDDLLGLLLESNLQHLREHGNAGMTTDEVVDECKLFYFAGQETTSLLLTWTMVVLSMHQDWQERAREEVLQAFGKEKPTFDGLNHLKTVTMILYEVLRLYPPAIGAVRQVFKSTKIGDVVYPPGVMLFLSILQVHHDPDFWGKDVDEFKPERFADGMYKASEKNAFFAFGGGHRVCIGQNFALLEAKLALCLILQRFSFDLSPSYTHAPAVVLTLKPQHGAPIRRNRSSRRTGDRHRGKGRPGDWISRWAASALITQDVREAARKEGLVGGIFVNPEGGRGVGRREGPGVVREADWGVDWETD
ncbi:hypothetical protein ZIOFF_068762 [Zingiber officinale]|uniref:Uncharacterized protein n=1 Tax=Zingiber officinale TaxID=94328 RepID=A0A8J5ETY2_ZINOF|nr:hypothetical protein ZIOFF_068762 [Zingiber officinale]